MSCVVRILIDGVVPEDTNAIGISLKARDGAVTFNGKRASCDFIKELSSESSEQLWQYTIVRSLANQFKDKRHRSIGVTFIYFVYQGSGREVGRGYWATLRADRPSTFRLPRFRDA